jgi:hypothetical protein
MQMPKEPETTKPDHDKAVLQLYDAICAIKTEAPAFDADWDKLAEEARCKRLTLIQRAFDAEWASGFQQGINEHGK